MSRVANAPIVLPAGVEIKLDGKHTVIKGKLGELSFRLSPSVELELSGNVISVKWDSAVKGAKAHAGTARASINNMVKGVSEGFVKKMLLVGVGYRAQVKDNLLTLSLGYSNPVEYLIPEGVTVEAPSQTELLVKSSDKQKLGQVASEIRAFRPPEPYKGKGVRIADEYVARKEAKKK
ncbi:50S ribosomal protein L6 [Methylomonas sp. EFPC3]|uniref:50S ribosomal protein L6 n=1 Tax=Methylomonas TaxID=416 RepID=UPI0011296300|nr:MULTISPECIES: 50S ribosomal protein L6 [Methylomonas]TPQ25202.1 50S ribosomal protein L6 [Methylomonas koyamae]WFP48623.1 50S ribosomal protein L6 [Methylomonas sp. EFPC3]